MMFDRSVLEFDQSETSISEGHAKVKKCITICVFDIITQCTNFSSTVFKQLFLWMDSVFIKTKFLTFISEVVKDNKETMWFRSSIVLCHSQQ